MSSRKTYIGLLDCYHPTLNRIWMSGFRYRITDEQAAPLLAKGKIRLAVPVDTWGEYLKRRRDANRPIPKENPSHRIAIPCAGRLVCRPASSSLLRRIYFCQTENNLHFSLDIISGCGIVNIGRRSTTEFKLASSRSKWNAPKRTVCQDSLRGVSYFKAKKRFANKGW